MSVHCYETWQQAVPNENGEYASIIIQNDTSYPFQVFQQLRMLIEEVQNVLYMKQISISHCQEELFLFSLSYRDVIIL
jgi:hypothetical protein